MNNVVSLNDFNYSCSSCNTVSNTEISFNNSLYKWVWNVSFDTVSK